MEPTMESGVAAGSGVKPLGAVVQIDDGQIRAHLDEVVRATVEETLNALLDAEADQLCGARKYERTEGRKDTRSQVPQRSRSSCLYQPPNSHHKSNVRKIAYVITQKSPTRLGGGFWIMPAIT